MDVSNALQETATVPTDLEVLRRHPAEPTSRPPLAFVHGAWHAAWCWDEHFLPWFAAAGYEAIALSLRGHGGSPSRHGRNRHSLRDYVDDVRTVVASLEVPPVLIGHSMGGAVVQRLLAGAGPSLAGAALLASPPPTGAMRATAAVARRHPIVFLAANATLDLRRVLGTPTLARDLLFSPNTADDLVLRYQQRMEAESYRAFLDMLVPQRRRQRSQELPVFVLGAGNDRFFTTSEIEATAGTWNAHAVIIEGLSHDVMLDGHWKEAATALHAWLETAVPDTPAAATHLAWPSPPPEARRPVRCRAATGQSGRPDTPPRTRHTEAVPR
jgi:pimeloyl-ACP methyl ester carboxylesterase